MDIYVIGDLVTWFRGCCFVGVGVWLKAQSTLKVSVFIAGVCVCV